MGAVAAAAAVIAGAVATATVAVVSVVGTVISAVGAAMAAVGSAIAGAVSAAVSYVAAGVSALASSVASGVSAAVGQIGSVLSGAYSAISGYAEAIYSAMQTFAEVIHLKTLMTIHKIAYLVSEDYRQMMNKIYGQIAKVSDELGLGAQFINLALENARSLVLSVSGMMGKSYDLAQITWLKSFSGFMKKFEDRVFLYEDNPAKVMQDINDFLLKDTVDTGASVQRTVFKALQGFAETMDRTVNEVTTIRDDLDKFVADLPKEIREEVKPYVDPVTEKVDGFLEDEYAPFKHRMDDIIDVLDNRQKTTRGRVDGIVDQMTRPGDLLRNVDSLEPEKRIEQENKVSEVAARSNERQADNLEAQAKPTWEHLQKLRQALEEPPPPPEYAVIERKKPIVPAGEQSREADTWFVGDY